MTAPRPTSRTQREWAAFFDAALIEEAGAPASRVTACSDSSSHVFPSVTALWAAKLPAAAERSWYRRGHKFWDGVPSSDFSGVLGGQQHVHAADVAESEAFLDRLVQSHPRVTAGVALDAGAGVGRVTEALLAHRFPAGVDLLEPSSRLLAAARARLAGSPAPAALGFIASGLQDFVLPPRRYSCVWLQWVVGTQLDADLVPLLAAAGAALAEGGLIVVKDNVAKGACWYDDEDSYVCRGEAYHRAVFAAAGLDVVAVDEQRAWDTELQRVVLFALAPRRA